MNMGKRFVILGGGESGVGAALLAKQQGYDVFVSDGSSLKNEYRNELQNAGIDFEEGKHTEEKILNADEVMKSPGIPEKAVIVTKIRAKGIDVISEVELAYRFKGDSKIIAITGSNGKTIVKEWLYQLLKDDFTMVRSPKSYNSQTGVPLSVWQLRPENTLALFEAGISKPN